MKKVLSIMLIILVVFSSMPMTVFGCRIGRIPRDHTRKARQGLPGLWSAEVDGHSVTEISSTTFKNDNSIVGIEIPNGVTTIGQGAFKNCLKAQYISLPATLKNIDTNTLTSNDDCVYIVERNSWM